MEAIDTTAIKENQQFPNPKVPPLSIKTYRHKTVQPKPHTSPLPSDQKKKQLPETTLTDSEKRLLNNKIKDFTSQLQTEINKKYPNEYMQSPLIEPQMTEQKNEILRKIKYF